MKKIKTLLLSCLISVFAIAQPGTWKQMGKVGEWVNTIKAIEANGTLIQ